jgi:acetyl esterase
MHWFWDQYCPDPARRTETDAAPLRAADLNNLPPALILTAEFDPLRDEGAAYAQKLDAAGTAVTYHCAPGLLHDFMAMGAVFPSVKPAMTLAYDKLRSALSG